MSRTSQPSTNPVKFAEPRPFSDPEAAVRKLIEIANAAEAVQDAASISSGSMAPFSPPAAVRPITAPASSARSRRAGCGGTNPEPTSNSPSPAPRYSPDGSDGLEASRRQSDPAARRPPARHPL